MASYSRLPRAVEDAEEKLAEVRTLVTDGARKLGGGLSTAAHELDAPAAADLSAPLADANLPELAGDDPLESLALRLDREADLWRSVGLRELAQIGRTDRIGLVAAVFAALADLSLAFVGGMTALFGAEGAAGRSMLLVAAGVVATGGAAAVGVFTTGIRNAQRTRAALALSRADLAELRLHRVAIALSVRKSDPAAFAGALERDAAG
jgi:hypothetical protein